MASGPLAVMPHNLHRAPCLCTTAALALEHLRMLNIQIHVTPLSRLTHCTPGCCKNRAGTDSSVQYQKQNMRSILTNCQTLSMPLCAGPLRAQTARQRSPAGGVRPLPHDA